MDKKEKIFKRILIDYQDRIYRLCWSYAQNEDDRKDLFQNILLKIWKNLDSFQGKSSLSTWIFRLSVNTSIDYMRQHQKLRRLSVEIDVSYLDIIDKSHNVEKNVLLSENIMLLHKFISQLSFIDRTLVYFYIEDLKYSEIAHILGISEKNVSVKVFRVKEKLKRYFKDFEK